MDMSLYLVRLVLLRLFNPVRYWVVTAKSVKLPALIPGGVAVGEGDGVGDGKAICVGEAVAGEIVSDMVSIVGLMMGVAVACSNTG